MCKPNAFNLQLLKGVVRSFLGDFEFKVDREKQTVTVSQKGITEKYSYAEVVELIDDTFNSQQ